MDYGIVEAQDTESFGRNEARLLTALLAYNLAHGLRLHAGVRWLPGSAMGRFRAEILRVPARLVLRDRMVIVSLTGTATKKWRQLLKRIHAMAP